MTQLFILISICLLIMILYKIRQNHHSSKPSNPTRPIYTIHSYSCKRTNYPSRLIREVFKNSSIQLVSTSDKNTVNQSIDLWIPNGYYKIESQLRDLSKQPNQLQYYSVLFGIDGCDKIVSKHSLWLLLLKEYGRKKARQIMPESYYLRNSQDRELLIEADKQKPKESFWILKNDKQRKQGLLLTRDISHFINHIEPTIQSSKDTYKLAQRFYDNSYTIQNHKFNFRFYLVILCYEQQIEWYLSRDGKIVYANQATSSSSKTSSQKTQDDISYEEHISSLQLDPSIYNRLPTLFSELHPTLQHQLYPQIKQLVRMIQQPCSRYLGNSRSLQSTVKIQYFGIDLLVLDDLSTIFLLEINKGPMMSYVNDKDKRLKQNLIHSLLLILQQESCKDFMEQI